ncbi:glycoside hydrolase family 16 protein [Aulographum hederae CBS 113979]|uniref:Glycoside hydrolase family 16 protein n=1 Tax=Aulographum hederae CBS 113979 TaxID=1176131 RepID=A0A6G1GZU6_9PEZI|nr:glycoside hydrolase family 16 protein [Aulographum hederae CBS 113979]
MQAQRPSLPSKRSSSEPRRISTSRFAEALSPITGSPIGTTHRTPHAVILSPKALSNTRASRPKKRRWGWKCWFILIAILIAIIVGVSVGVVLGLRANAYPNYNRLYYTLQDDYSGPDFFSNFDYFSGYDPSSGFVHYVDQPTAALYNLTYASSTSAVLRVDTSADDASTGRRSVRITSKKSYDQGLFIFDILNIPWGCGTWPALWLADPENWPNAGEIDVVEGVNLGREGNQATLHTTKGCRMSGKRKMWGQGLEEDCWNLASENEGCGVRGSQESYGEAFNANGGGIYALEYRRAGLRIWFFPRSSIPPDLQSPSSSTQSPFTSPSSPPYTTYTSPDPSSWGTPLADFPATNCDIARHFGALNLIANIDLCGDWAGQVGVFGTGCPGTCTDFVRGNPLTFGSAYWEWRGWRVYQAWDAF